MSKAFQVMEEVRVTNEGVRLLRDYEKLVKGASSTGCHIIESRLFSLIEGLEAVRNEAFERGLEKSKEQISKPDCEFS